MADSLLTLPRPLLLRVWLRTFLLQASWNFECLQGLGVAYVLAPALRYYYRDEELARAYGRHTEYFNTHPYLAPALLGTMLNLEEEGRRSGSDAGVAEFRNIMMAPCAAMGDAFFWGGLRPLAAVLALFFALHGELLAPLVLLAVFNFPHLLIRWQGFWLGYHGGLEIVDRLQQWRLPDRAIRLKQGTVILLGLLCADLTMSTLLQERHDAAWGVVLIPLALLVGVLTRFGVSPMLQVLGGAMLLLICSHSGG